MSNLCPDLATKEQLASLERQVNRELERKIPTTEKDSIVNDGGLKGKSLVAGSIALIGGTANNAFNKANQAWSGANQAMGTANNAWRTASSAQSTAGLANFRSITATNTATQATYQANYAASRAASAANLAKNSFSTALKAFNTVAGIYSILSSFATTAALGYLTKQVDKLNNITTLQARLIKQNEIRNSKNSLINGKQQSQIDTINQANRIRDIQYRELAYQVDLQKAQVAKNTSDIAAFKASTTQQIESLKRQYQEQIDSLIKTNSDLQQKINKSNKDIQQVNSQIKDNNLRFEALEQRVSSQLKDLDKVDSENLEKVIEKQVNKEINENIKIRNLNDKVTNYDLDIQTLKSNSKGLESSIQARDLEVIKQAKDLEKRVNDLKDNGIKTDIKIDELDREIRQKDNQVDQKQVQDINLKLDKLDDKISSLPDPATIALAVGGLDILRQIKQNSSKSTCQAPTLVPPVAAQAKANGGSILGLQALNTIQNTNIQRTIDAVDKTVTITKNVVTHAKYGLEAIQKFAQIAWKATRIGKILEYLSLAATIHNAAMLSRNLGGSLGDTVSAIANNTISLIKNEEFQGIDINQTLGTSIESFLKGLIGAENYTGVSETLSKYNRILNSASNVIYSITSIQAGLAQGLETIGNYTGRIGNALKKSGQVLESSYGWMSEKVSVKTGRLGQIQRVIDTGEGIENVLSDVENATQEFRGSQESVNNIGQQYKKVKTEFTKQETEKAALETTVKTNSQGAQPELTDFVKDPIEE